MSTDELIEEMMRTNEALRLVREALAAQAVAKEALRRTGNAGVRVTPMGEEMLARHLSRLTQDLADAITGESQ